jgi:hypothetical protein
MSPSPTRAEYQRCPVASSAFAAASPATTVAVHATTAVSRRRMPWSMMTWSSTGIAVSAPADSTVIARYTAIPRR